MRAEDLGSEVVSHELPWDRPQEIGVGVFIQAEYMTKVPTDDNLCLFAVQFQSVSIKGKQLEYLIENIIFY